MAGKISTLINYFGSQSKTGEALGVSQATVSYWLSGSQRVSPEKALLAESVTQGLIKASSLCDVIAQVEARHKLGESSPDFVTAAPGANGSVCASSTRDCSPCRAEHGV
jgi:DNA-binding transcriptional regulator YdaS (Cro superfamily)